MKKIDQVLVIVFCVLSLTDLLFTSALYRMSMLEELNPIADAFLQSMGVWGLILLKFIGICMPLSICYGTGKTKLICGVGILANSVVVVMGGSALWLNAM